MGRKLIVVILLGFSITLATVIGLRMSTEAMAVVIGVVFGVAAGLPTSILVAAVTRRERFSAPIRAEAAASSSLRSLPPVIIVTPSGQGQTMSGYPAPWIPMVTPPAPPQRQVQIIGGDAEVGEEW